MPIGLRTMLVYSAGSIGAGAFYAFNNFLLPLALKAAGAPDLLTGLLSSTRSIEGVVIQPTVGAASDRIWTRLGRRRPFIAICIPLSALFVFCFGFSAILPSLTLFLTTDIHLTDQVALALAALALLVTAVTAIAWGKVADRYGQKRVLAIGWATLVVAAFGGTVIRELPETIVVVVLAGVGNGAQTAVSWPLLTTLIDPDESGIFAGLKAAAESVAIPLSVFVAAELFLNPRALNLGYRGIFFMLAINMILALILLIAFVHPPQDTATASAAAAPV